MDNLDLIFGILTLGIFFSYILMLLMNETTHRGDKIPGIVIIILSFGSWVTFILLIKTYIENNEVNNENIKRTK